MADCYKTSNNKHFELLQEWTMEDILLIIDQVVILIN